MQSAEDASNILVVGGGPCGSFTALNLAKHGIESRVIEEHKEIGLPAHCAGHLSIRGLRNLGLYPLPKGVIENTYNGAVFHSPLGNQFRVRFSSPVTCSVNRALFDRFLASQAEAQGARYLLGSRVDSLIIENAAVKGARIEQDGERRTLLCKVLVDAEGISSRLRRQAGLSRSDSSIIVRSVEAEVQNVTDIEPDMVEVFLGRQYAPGFYAWLMPRKDGSAKLGLATDEGNPREMFQRLISKSAIASMKLRSAKTLNMTFHAISIGGPISRICTNGLVVVGDAASQVKPTTGGGIIWGLNCARFAAETISHAFSESDFSFKVLASYQSECKRFLGFDAKLMLIMRNFLNRLTDKQIDDLVRFCSRFEMNKMLEKVDDIDFQGRALLPLFRTPHMFVALFFLVKLLISANA